MDQQEATDQEERVEFLRDQITGPLSRRYGTATILFHHAVATHLGLGPADHKCLDLLFERGPMTASQLARITGLTSGAVSGLVSRLEKDGRIRREQDPNDGRRQLLSVREEGNRDLMSVFESVDTEKTPIVHGLDRHQLEAVAQYLEEATRFAYRRMALLRGLGITGDQTLTARGTREKQPERENRNEPKT